MERSSDITSNGVLATTVTLVTAGTIPAWANNVDLPVGQPTLHHGMWRDGTDQLGACLGGTGTFYKAVVTIRPADGQGPVFSVTDSIVGNSCTYTANLSIPEDERYVMTLIAYGRYGNQSGSVAFYT